MNDVEKIVLFFFIHKTDTAPASRIQKWAMLSGNRLKAAFDQCGGKVFELHPNAEDPAGYDVSIIRCPEVERIVKKHEDLLGIREK